MARRAKSSTADTAAPTLPRLGRYGEFYLSSKQSTLAEMEFVPPGTNHLTSCPPRAEADLNPPALRVAVFHLPTICVPEGSIAQIFPACGRVSISSVRRRSKSMNTTSPGKKRVRPHNGHMEPNAKEYHPGHPHHLHYRQQQCLVVS